MKIIIQNIRDFLLRKKRKGKKLLFFEKIGDKNSSRDAIHENLIKVLILFILSSNFTHAEIVKPNNGIEPYQVIKIQLRGLMKNDNPKMDSGIEQTWEFAHPENQKYTGPLENFKKMLESDNISIQNQELQKD